MRKIKTAIIITIFLLLFCFQASAGAFAPSFAQILRINTGAQISVVLASDEAEAQNGQGGIISVREIGADVFYERISDLIAEGEQNYPYISGADVLIEITDANGVRKEKLTAIKMQDTSLEEEKIYTVALSKMADKHFEDCEKTMAYSADNELLYRYITGFGQHDESVQEQNAETASENIAQSGEVDYLAKQGNTLLVTITILAIVILIYIYARKKKTSD